MSFNKTVFLPVDPDTAFALITEPERLRRWKTIAARVDLRLGGEYRWTITPGHVAMGIFQEIEPGKRVVYTWGWEGSGDLPPGASTVTVNLEAVDGGTTVQLIHEGLTGEQETAHAAGWNHFLDRLVLLAGSGDAGPDEWSAAPDPMDELGSAEAALAVAQRVLRGVSESDLASPTPCEDFTVAGLLDHLHGSIASIGVALGVAVADHPAATPEVRIADAARDTLEAFRARGTEGSLDMGFAELPATLVAGILNLELLVHAWDLATATGQKLVVSPVLTDYVLGLARVTIGPQARGTAFAAEVLVDESAASLERLIGFTGREVAGI
ncbi:TIGR03086 family metal-binding protein [Arthrobacter sp. PAMC25284]|uniref:TIGR03086 family metal-binding protein n=1 Tax=Arthrobacter sp. PAMC25284 TaxID=2861279 RepID=UPI001C62BB5C|nr:TIGR03086 family metal-binding protein [Arthrobacter sp. PAMC25284]QYF90057.1 TIGR03086 family protein [Arthrobacter sp. PAMC25284]